MDQFLSYCADIAGNTGLLNARQAFRGLISRYQQQRAASVQPGTVNHRRKRAFVSNILSLWALDLYNPPAL